MAEISAFKGLRYNLEKVGDLSEVFAPPYDVIDAKMRDELISGGEYNIARITRSPEAEGEPEEQRYSTAAKLLKSWREQGALELEKEPALYIYEQEFSVGEDSYSRLGLVCGLKLVDFGKGVHPHEETLSGAKKDRRLLLEQTRTHLGQIFGLYPDEKGEVNAILARVKQAEPPWETAHDGEGVVHRFWAVTDPAEVSALVKALADKDVFIADGHHRYETALKYSREHPELPAAACVMATLVALSDPGLVVLPTHRLVHSLPDFDLERLESALAENFEVKSMSFEGDDRGWHLKGLLGQMAERRAAGENAFGLYGGGGRISLVVLKNAEAVKAAAPDHCEAWRELDVAVLHSLILEKLLGIDREKLAAKTNLDYLKDTGEAIESAVKRIDAGEAQCVFIMNSTAVKEVAAVATAGEKMPQKSTFFHPKIFTGGVLMPLED
ncbi:MAG: DUF1015 domain-containing protein [Planctomycetota bacterium]